MGSTSFPYVMPSPETWETWEQTVMEMTEVLTVSALSIFSVCYLLYSAADTFNPKFCTDFFILLSQITEQAQVYHL